MFNIFKKKKVTERITKEQMYKNIVLRGGIING